jgi:hypothetical protein
MQEQNADIPAPTALWVVGANAMNRKPVFTSLFALMLVGCSGVRDSATESARLPADADGVLVCRVVAEGSISMRDSWWMRPEVGMIGLQEPGSSFVVIEERVRDSFKSLWAREPHVSPRIVLDLSEDPNLMTIGLAQRVAAVRRAAVAAGASAPVHLYVVLPDPEKFPNMRGWP